ncbi:TRAP transporter large permease subunit [Chloroflexota bacterium]
MYPPVGLKLFVIRGVTGIPLSISIKGTMPFMLMMLLTVVIIYFFPQLVTGLPSTIR